VRSSRNPIEERCCGAGLAIMRQLARRCLDEKKSLRLNTFGSAGFYQALGIEIRSGDQVLSDNCLQKIASISEKVF
jgi:hypothetical protein